MIHAGAIISRLPRRDQHDRRALSAAAELFDQPEAVDVRELHVNEHHIGTQAPEQSKRGATVGTRPHHPVAGGFQQLRRLGAETGVVVDDHRSPRHHEMVPYTLGTDIRANPQSIRVPSLMNRQGLLPTVLPGDAHMARTIEKGDVMAATPRHGERVRSRIQPVVAWTLLAGGAMFFLGGAMHPKQDPPDVTLKEHLRIMYEDGNWYPGHTVLLFGMALIAAALVALVRSGALARVRSAHVAGVAAAATSSLGAVAASLHLTMATEADRIAAGQSTPLTNANLVVETIVTPAFGLSVAALAVIGVRTGSIGNRAAAALAVVGGTAYALAGGTFLLTDALDPLFPLAGLLGAWAIVTAVSLLRHTRTTDPSPLALANR